MKCWTRPGLAPCVTTAVGPSGFLAAERQSVLAQRIIRAQRGRQVGVGIAAGPGLDAGVEIERALRAAELHQREARDFDRHVEQEVAWAEQRLQHGGVILAGQRLHEEAHAKVLGLFLAAILGGDDRHLIGLHVDVAQDQRQNALTDAAETDDHQSAAKFYVFCRARHDALRLRVLPEQVKNKCCTARQRAETSATKSPRMC